MNSHAQRTDSDSALSQSTRTIAVHPMRDLLIQLRKVQPEVTITGTTAIPHRLRAPMAESAETVMAVCQNGMAALGHLLAHSSPVIEDGTVGADSVEALGWLIAELGDMTAYCLVLAAECRRDPSCAGLSKVA